MIEAVKMGVREENKENKGENISYNLTGVEPEPVLRNVPQLFQVFHNVQFNTVHHRKYVKELKRLYHKIDEFAFKESFVNALHYTFTFGDANGNVDRVLQFIASFCTALNDEDDFLHYIFDIIFDCVSVTGQSIRNRSCQLLGLILAALGEDASLDDNVCDKILSTQLERLQDVKGAVRCRAVLTLQRLQNPMEEDDPVSKAYIFHMSSDPSAAVRRAVVLSIAKTSKNLLHVLERLCDIDESVRKAAFLYVSSINVTQLKVRQRVHILKVGLTERNPRVRKIVETVLISTWLGSYKGNILDLLAAVRLDNLQGAKDSAMVAGNLLQSLFKHQQLTELIEWLPIDRNLKLIPAENLNKESSLYWRHLVRHLHSNGDTDHLEQTLPELITFTNYVRVVVESECPPSSNQKEFSKRQYVLQELINIFPVYDMADEVGRLALQTLLYDTLTGNVGPLNEEVIQAIMRAIDVVIPNLQNRIEFVSGVISEIHEPVGEPVVPLTPTVVESNETKMARMQLRVSLNEALEQQHEAVSAQDFVLAALCKEKVDAIQKKMEDMNLNLKEIEKQQQPVEVVREKKEDANTLNKCLLILNMFLDSPQITKIPPFLMEIFENFKSMIFQNVEIRENALKTLALYSMLDEEFAKEHKDFFFTQFMDMNNENIMIIALKCVIDIMCIHGVKTFNIDNACGDENEKISNSSKTSKRKSNTFKKNKSRNRHSNRSSSSSDSSDEDGDKTNSSPSTHDTIIELFLRFLHSECVQYREVVVEGFCRLLMIGRLSSSSLISRLLLLWFNPATEEEDTLRQLLGTFFPLFATHVENAQEQLEAAFIPTLTTLANAPHSSPLSEVDFEAVLKFMIGLTLPTVSPTAHNVHSNLCVSIMNALERGSDLTEPLLCRALALLTPPRTLDLCKDLLHSVNGFIDSVTDRISFRNLSRFQAILSMNIENIEQRSSNNGLETLVEETTELSINLTNRTSGKRKSNEKEENCQSNEDSETVSSSSTSKTSDPKSMSPLCSPPRKIRALRGTNTGKKITSGSALKLRTPRSTRSAVSGTPQSSRRLQITPKPSSSKSTRSVRALEAQLNDAAEKEPEETQTQKAKKAPSKATKTGKNKRQADKSPEKKSEKPSFIENKHFSDDDDTMLFTIRHDESEEMQILQDSSDEERHSKIQNKARPNITVPASDSSDDLFSDDDDEMPISQQRRK